MSGRTKVIVIIIINIVIVRRVSGVALHPRRRRLNVILVTPRGRYVLLTPGKTQQSSTVVLDYKNLEGIIN